MPREKELYRDTLERFRERADKLFPDKLVYTQTEAAKIVGRSTKTLQRRNLSRDITAEQLASIFS